MPTVKYYTIATIMVILLLCISFVFDTTQANQMQKQTELIQEIVETHKYTESLIKNVMFKVQFDEEIAPGVIYEDQTLPVNRVKKLKYLYEPKGRIRIEEQLVKIDGLDGPVGDSTTFTGNLRDERTLSDIASNELKYLSIKKYSGFAHSLRKPTFFIKSLKPLSKLIKNALDEAMPIKVNHGTGEHSRHIVLRVPARIGDDTYEVVYWLDPEKLYYPLRIETYLDDKLIRTRTSTSQRIQNDIWMPLQAVYESFDLKGQRREKVKMKVDEVKVNMSELPDALFTIEISQGTHVADSRGGATLEYIVGVGHEADMMLDELASLALSDEFVPESKYGHRKIIRVEPSNKKTDEESKASPLVSKTKKVEDGEEMITEQESQIAEVTAPMKFPSFIVYFLLISFVLLVIAVVLSWHLRRNKTISNGEETK